MHVRFHWFLQTWELSVCFGNLLTAKPDVQLLFTVGNYQIKHVADRYKSPVIRRYCQKRFNPLRLNCLAFNNCANFIPSQPVAHLRYISSLPLLKTFYGSLKSNSGPGINSVCYWWAIEKLLPGGRGRVEHFLEIHPMSFLAGPWWVSEFGVGILAFHFRGVGGPEKAG